MKCQICKSEDARFHFTIKIKKVQKEGSACLQCAQDLAKKVGIDPVDIYEADSFGYDI